MRRSPISRCSDHTPKATAAVGKAASKCEDTCFSPWPFSEGRRGRKKEGGRRGRGGGGRRGGKGEEGGGGGRRGGKGEEERGGEITSDHFTLKLH